MIPAYVKYLGDTSNKTAGTTLAQVLQGGGSAAGNLIVARVIFDNAGTASKPIVSSISKMAGETNNWVFLGAARSTSTTAGAFASGEMWCIRTTVAWSGTITVTLDTSVTQKAVLMEEFSGAQAVLRSTVGTAYSTTTTAASAATTGTAPAINDLALGLIFGSNAAAQQSADTDTTAGSWSARAGLGSTGGNVATNNFGFGQYKILTAATHQTFNSSAAMTAGNGSIVAILQSVPDPSVTQAAYQFFDDAGTESGATSLAALNTATTGNLTAGDGFGVLRVRLQSTTAVAIEAFDDWQLQWEKNASGNWINVSTDSTEVLATSASPQNTTWGSGSSSAGSARFGQSFMGNGQRLTRIRGNLKKVGAPTCGLRGELRAHSGTFGTSSTAGALIEAGSSMLTSDLTTSFAYYQFNFANTSFLSAGTPYVVAAWTQAGGVFDGSTNTMDAGVVSGAASHPGNFVASSGPIDTVDWAFEVYTTPVVGVVSPYNNPNLTGTAATTNRLGAGTGSFVAGKISEDGVVNDLGWAGNNYTELVYSLKLIAADLADGDTLRFRVVRNGVTTGMTYTQTPTINITNLAAPPPNEGSATVAHTWSTGGVAYSDNFNRGDGALGAPWVTVDGALSIVSSKAAASANLDVSRYNQTFAPDQWAEANVAGFAAGGSCITVCLRINGSGDLYYLWLADNPTSIISINKRVGGGYSTVVAGPATSGPFRARLEMQGTTLRAYVNDTLAVTGTDSSIATGQPGVLGANGVGATLDDFRSGDLPYGAGGPVGKRTPKAATTTSWTAILSAVGVSPVPVPAGARIDESGLVRTTEAGETRMQEVGEPFVAHVISASGAGVSAGSAAIARIHPVSASGAGLSLGSAALTAILRAAASGAGTSAGSAVIARTLPVAASGTGISAGGIALTAILRATGSGIGLSAGSAAIARALPVAASGTGLSAGSAALISTLRVAAYGTGTSTGSAAVGILGGAVDHPISASGTGTSTGTVALISTLAVAATGTGLFAGQATLARAMPTSAAGTGLTGGTAAFTPIAMSASGSGQTAGSVALISTLVVRGVGTGTSAGSAAISRGHPLTASGTGTLFGSVAIGVFTGPIDHSMAGHGLMQSGGSVALISSLVMRGVGTGQTTGIATLRRIMPIAAGGSGLSGGSVSISRSMPLVASGTGQTAGVIALRREMPLSAVGIGTFAGAVAIKVGGQMSLTAAGLGRFRGSVSIFLKVPMVDVNVTVGALREVEQFAIGEMRGGETAVGGYGEDVFEVSDFAAVASIGQIRLDVLFGFGEMDGEVTIGDLEATPPVTIGGFSAASSVGPLRED